MVGTRDYIWKAPDIGEIDDATPDSTTPFRIGLVGVGEMGTLTLRQLLSRPRVIVSAICDVDERHLDRAEAIMASETHPRPATRHKDFRDLHTRRDIDAVVISTPDHWHALQAIDAMRSGKDVYVEKPLTLTIAEGRRICEVAQETESVCQTGSQQRSSREFRHACELIRNGYLGSLRLVDICIPPNNRSSETVTPPQAVPPELDYDMWLGPAPERPYRELTCHYAFRFVSDFSGGQMTNWGAHNLDIVQWAMDADRSGPVHVQGTGRFPENGVFDTPDDVDVVWTYACGTAVRCRTGTPHCRFEGTNGSIEVGRGHFVSTPTSLQTVALKPEDIRLYRSDDHMGNFLSCIRTRRQPVCPPETGHRSATVCHLGNIAMRLKRRLEWDPVTESFVNDDEANSMRSRLMRAPWTLD